MTLFAMFWVAHLPLSLGVMPHPSSVALLEEATSTQLPLRFAQTASSPSLLASSEFSPSDAASPAAEGSSSPPNLVALQGLGSSPIRGLAATVNWQRWINTATVTVVDTAALAEEEAAVEAMLPNVLASDTCPAAHPATPEVSPPVSEKPGGNSEGKAADETTADAATFVVRVKGVAIGQVASAAVAEEVATDLREALPTLAQHPQALTPTLDDETGIGQLENQAIFTLPPEAIRDADSMALTTAQWVNNLRLALGAEPLNPGQVQRVAYGLDPTSTQFQGTASWYGPYFHGRQTATGEIFDQEALTAAHKTLPFDTYLEVRNLLNGRTVVVRINDRGPYVGERSLDLSYAAARCLGSVQVGVIPYEATILTPGNPQAWEEAALPL
ncbi:hypothetical protein GFS31_35000 [Leptolyngbya sp. BL0902]|uniref:septal ring lytic transglycosylase RlpA family protein n=1 Tax=Leptolyngbya sp. BL0902 TaxID=1115757 RepID=UPI0019376D57|nr:septal ring lytic transglycosylase RlpA family protein [Leptolyngbya sp. BL0902]QQE66797.1 hypothetical protein GFS31_35000 [Leptolyngbya sp. BL0902]